MLVPYDKDGKRLEPATGGGAGDPRRRMWWDLREGQAVKLTRPHNIQGAQQPCYLHIGGKQVRKHKGEVRKPGPGNGRVVRRDEAQACLQLSIEGAGMKLGLWYIDAAVRGAIEQLPVVNANPSFEE